MPSAPSEAGAAVVLVRLRLDPNLGRDADGFEKLGLLSSLVASSSATAAGSAVVLVPGRGLEPKRPPNFLGLVSV